VVEGALVHAVVQRAYLLLEQLLLNGAHLEHCVIVGTEQLIEPVDVSHVVLLLQRDIDNRIGDFLADAVQELSFADDYLEPGVKVDLKSPIVPFTNGNQDVFGQVLGCSLHVLSLPLLKHLEFVVFCEQFGGLDVVSRGLLPKTLTDQDVRLGLELVDG